MRPVIFGISQIAKALQLRSHAVYEDFFFRIAVKEVAAVDWFFCHEAQVVAEKVFHVFIRIVKEDPQPPRPALKGIEDLPQDPFQGVQGKGVEEETAVGFIGQVIHRCIGQDKGHLVSSCRNRSSYSMPIERHPV